MADVFLRWSRWTDSSLKCDTKKLSRLTSTLHILLYTKQLHHQDVNTIKWVHLLRDSREIEREEGWKSRKRSERRRERGGGGRVRGGREEEEGEWEGEGGRRRKGERRRRRSERRSCLPVKTRLCFGATHKCTYSSHCYAQLVSWVNQKQMNFTVLWCEDKALKIFSWSEHLNRGWIVSFESVWNMFFLLTLNTAAHHSAPAASLNLTHWLYLTTSQPQSDDHLTTTVTWPPHNRVCVCVCVCVYTLNERRHFKSS